MHRMHLLHSQGDQVWNYKIWINIKKVSYILLHDSINRTKRTFLVLLVENSLLVETLTFCLLKNESWIFSLCGVVPLLSALGHLLEILALSPDFALYDIF